MNALISVMRPVKSLGAAVASIRSLAKAAQRRCFPASPANRSESATGSEAGMIVPRRLNVALSAAISIRPSKSKD